MTRNKGEYPYSEKKFPLLRGMIKIIRPFENHTGKNPLKALLSSCIAAVSMTAIPALTHHPGRSLGGGCGAPLGGAALIRVKRKVGGGHSSSPSSAASSRASCSSVSVICAMVPCHGRPWGGWWRCSVGWWGGVCVLYFIDYIFFLF